MKKFLAFLFSSLMLFSVMAISACDNGSTPSDKEVNTLNEKTPEQLYSLAMDTVKELDNFQLDIVQVIEMSYEGETMTMNQTVTTKKAGQNEYLKSTNDMGSGEMEAWYVDETFYGILPTGKMYAKISYEQYVEKFMPDGATAEGALMNIPAEWFVDVKFQKVSDNEYYLEFIVSGEEYKQFMNGALNNMVDGIENISYKVYFDGKGTLGNIVTAFEMDVMGVKASVISTATISNIGTTTITAPDVTDGSWVDVTGRI
ncbi:MAG: hypothetical protein J5993_03065 [Clostridia bacterium]|nr:hypothetical protein [Clostridia bacterium]